MRQFLTEKEVCEYYKISRSSVREHFGYAVIHIGRSIRYDLMEIEARTGAKNEGNKESN